MTHSNSLQTAISAAKTAGIPLDRVVVLDSLHSLTHATINELIATGCTKPAAFIERRLKAGEARTKLALLCFSSGTTGKPKAVAVPHYSMIANVIQARLGIGYPPQYYPGDVALAGKRNTFIQT